MPIALESTSDNASGVAALLEVARLLAARPLARSVPSLETIGYYSDAAGSQKYPNPLYAWLYPNTGNFIGFVGNLASRKLVRQCLGSFRRYSAFPSEGIAAPGRMMGIHWSDHWSFWQEGYAAVMVTALFRYPHYHASTDLPDRIDYERLARVVEGLVKVTVDLTQKQ